VNEIAPLDWRWTVWELNDVTKIEYTGGHRCHIVFDDGTAGEVDFAECLDKGPVFAPLRDLDFFQQARIEGGAISWPNGADIAPESLYERLKKTQPTTPPAGTKPRTRKKYLTP
jgi:hypothetical protein